MKFISGVLDFRSWGFGFTSLGFRFMNCRAHCKLLRAPMTQWFWGFGSVVLGFWGFGFGVLGFWVWGFGVLGFGVLGFRILLSGFLIICL